ncbi:MAG: hypothetical protein ACJ754_27515 [Pyrinomonadaceae bacterium]
MSEEKKYVTFRDLRVVSPAQKSTTSPASTSTPSTSSTPSASIIPEVLELSPVAAIIDKEEQPEPQPNPSDRLGSTSTSSNTSISRTSSSISTSKISLESETRPQPDGSAEKPKRPAVAPERDFQRIPNSITRRAIPEGVFRGKSKQVWDYLWSVTRGGIVPVKSTRKSRREIKAGSGLGSMVTVDAALEHLESVGLIAVRPAVGSLSGNEYEIFTPDEAYTSTPSSASTPSTTRITQKVDELDVPESGSTSTTQLVENTEGSGQPNTSFKTKDINTDDEAFAEFAAVVRKTAKEITGKDPSKGEAARWAEVAEVLMTELRIAAGRTTVSSVPAFLAEHLRRRLWKKEKRQIEAEAAEQKASIPARKVDASKCPDCFGTGMYYPNGFDKGVARCPHSKLIEESES